MQTLQRPKWQQNGTLSNGKSHTGGERLITKASVAEEIKSKTTNQERILKPIQDETNEYSQRAKPKTQVKSKTINSKTTEALGLGGITAGATKLATTFAES